MGSLLDVSIQRNKIFLDELLRKLQKPSIVQDVKVYRKPEQEETFKSKKTKTPAKIDQEIDTKQISIEFEASASKTTRRSCECQASKHKLIANCLKCGRIVCTEEGFYLFHLFHKPIKINFIKRIGSVLFLWQFSLYKR